VSHSDASGYVAIYVVLILISIWFKFVIHLCQEVQPVSSDSKEDIWQHISKPVSKFEKNTLFHKKIYGIILQRRLQIFMSHEGINLLFNAFFFHFSVTKHLYTSETQAFIVISILFYSLFNLNEHSRCVPNSFFHLC